MRGDKRYELTNHLGNVMAVISDRRFSLTGDEEDPRYRAYTINASEYYPFGLEMEGRKFNFSDYRFGFNGKEADSDSEWGSATHYDYGFRIYNPSIGKFLSVDPLSPDYPMLTPYQYASNNPAALIDLDGLEGVFPKSDPSDQGVRMILRNQRQFRGQSPFEKYNTLEFSILHLTVDREPLSIRYSIYQTAGYSRSNSYYLAEFTSMFPVQTAQATRLANVLDPGSSYSGYLSKSDYTNYVYGDMSDERRKSVVGTFIEAASSYGITGGRSNFFGKVFRHQVYSGMLTSIYGNHIGKMIGDFNEMGNQGDYNVFKLDIGHLGAADLINNAWGVKHMESYIGENGEIGNIDDFTGYLNYVADKIINYGHEEFEDLNGMELEFSSEMEGVQNLYNYFKSLKE